MDAQRGLSVSGHRNTVLCLHLTSDTYHVTPSGRAPRARGKFWIRRVKLRIFRPDPKSHKSEGFPAAQIFKTHKCQNTYCRSAHFSKAVKFVGAQNPRGTPCGRGRAARWPGLLVTRCRQAMPLLKPSEFLASVGHGHCGETADLGDCTIGEKGSFKLTLTNFGNAAARARAPPPRQAPRRPYRRRRGE